jgi:hypothetical protein
MKPPFFTKKKHKKKELKYLYALSNASKLEFKIQSIALSVSGGRYSSC